MQSESKMKKTIAVIGLLAAIGMGQGRAMADNHPELSDADEAYSAENYEKAAALYRKDAELGVIAAQVNLALMHVEGQGVRQDYQQAAKWFLKAAEQGNTEAQYNLGLLHQEGKGVAQSLVEADKWFSIAGAKANAESAERNMSTEQIADAKKLAADWTARFRKAKER